MNDFRPTKKTAAYAVEIRCRRAVCLAALRDDERRLRKWRLRSSPHRDEVACEAASALRLRSAAVRACDLALALLARDDRRWLRTAVNARRAASEAMRQSSAVKSHMAHVRAMERCDG